MNNEFILQDRIQKIKQIINQYGIDNFYISFSGGKDSTIIHYLIDIAIPDNNIPRVYIDTGIELNIIKDFVNKLSINDNRINIIKPTMNIKEMLNNVGYPFKSKEHSYNVSMYQRNGVNKTVEQYLNPDESRKTFGCIKKLLYQFDDEFDLKISNKCCDELKKKPVKKWAKENNKPFTILGLRQSEKGIRANSGCLSFRNKTLYSFNPLFPINDEWCDWFITEYNINICDIYKEPYNFKRTGCKGCPYNIDLQEELEILEKFFPNERKQCEYIWKPVYEEYRRINYRLKEKGR